MKIRKILLFIFIIVIGLQTPVYAEGEPKESKLYARSACLIDGDSGRVLYAKNANEQLANASTTKIMTCIVALESGQLDAIVTASERAAKQPKVHMGVKKGEQFILRDLLYSLMLESHNDAAVIIAEHVGGSVEGFAKMMNAKAKEIGCEKTNFITPNGLDEQNKDGKHGTSAQDLARIMRYCIMESKQKDAFLEITRTPAYSFWNKEETRIYNCNNHNAFLGMMEGALSGKTGFTGDAGYCYVGSLRRDGRTFIVALLACGWPNNKSYKWADTKALMTYGIEQYGYQDVLEKDKDFKPMTVENGQYEGRLGDKGAKIQLTTNLPKDAQFNVLLRKDEKVEVEYELPDKLAAPIKTGVKVGKVRYRLGDEIIKEYPIYTANSVNKIDFTWCFDIIKDKFLLIR